MRLILLNVLIGLLAAIIAQSKGYPFIRWWINGAIWGPFSLIYVVLMKRQEPPRNEQESLSACPHCRKMVSIDLNFCPHCEKKIDIVDI